MPNLDFYAVDDDWSAVLDTVFDSGLFRVLQADSRPGHELREFHNVDETVGAGERRLMLFVTGAGPEPTARRIDFAADASNAGFRYTCEGWGLIQLYYGGFFREQELRWSHTNHNTEKRAAAWAPTTPRIGDPAAWDWKAVTSASSKLNRAIGRLAVDKVNSHPVLPAAARLIEEANLRYEYGTGIHATPAFGSSPS
ncbi:hypothetical protein AB0J82_36615 [Asanoa sp. NPDC049518]|uniref:hypothetical protein n=1 Tax=unclassified Asanoa TaxID=2685164 RepID=UPI00344579E0